MLDKDVEALTPEMAHFSSLKTGVKIECGIDFSILPVESQALLTR